ncbi:MAG: insulinase family protein [Bacilli bacterium]|nr:insulinase family protein [Bacilli bacterium]
MVYNCYDMNAYNLHIIKTDKFKTITVEIAFRRKIKKEEITIRNLLKELIINSSYNYPTEKKLIIETEKLYDLKLLTSNYRIGNSTIFSLKSRFLNEKYTEEGMNKESIRFLLDILFNPRLDNEVDKCKKRLEKSINSLSDNKVKYSLFKLLEHTGNMPYSYNSYGYLDDLEKITHEDILAYYNDMIRNDIIDVFVVGEVSDKEIKEIFKEYFKVTTYHKQKIDIITKELSNVRKIKEYNEKDNVNQTQLAILYNVKGLTDRERKYVFPVYGEMLGGSSNSILFENVRGKNSYAYYVNSIVKSYDNIMMVYSGIDGNNTNDVKKIIDKSLKEINKGKIDKDKFESAKKTIISGIKASLDNPMGIINNYYAKMLVNSDDIDVRIENVNNVSINEIISLSKKISMYSYFVLEASNEEDNN